VLYLYVVAAVAVLFEYLAKTAIMPAAFAIERSICRKNKRPLVASASQRASFGSSSAAGQTFTNECRQGPNGRTAEPTSAFAIRSKPSKHKPSEHASAKKSTFAPSATTSADSN
jgi:hypothetical protein